MKHFSTQDILTGKPLSQAIFSCHSLDPYATWSKWHVNYNELLQYLNSTSRSSSPDYHSIKHYYSTHSFIHTYSSPPPMPSSTVKIIVIFLKWLPLLMAYSINVTILYKEVCNIIREQ